MAEAFRRRKVEEIRKAVMLEKKVMVQLIQWITAWHIITDNLQNLFGRENLYLRGK